MRFQPSLRFSQKPSQDKAEDDDSKRPELFVFGWFLSLVVADCVPATQGPRNRPCTERRSPDMPLLEA